MSRDREILLDIVKACNLIQVFCQDLNLKTFSEELKTQSSLLYQIVIIGEAFNRLSPELIPSNPQVPCQCY